MKTYESWGRFAKARHASVIPVYWRSDPPDLSGLSLPVLAFGRGRSYGDVCLNDGGALIETEHLARFISLNQADGLLRCESGIQLADILEVTVPQGWILPVIPGTQYVTVGGAIANDVHGKNHHRVGTFGCHITQLELLRSSGERLLCTPSQTKRLFEATISGLGLTGLILWAEIQLKAISSPWIEVRWNRFDSFQQFAELSAVHDGDHEYTVAWLDGLRLSKRRVTGVFIRGNCVSGIPATVSKGPATWEVPFDLPLNLLNRLTVRILNWGYSALHAKSPGCKIVPYQSFFFPLDRIRHWNRVYGARGFVQHQCVLPGRDQNRHLQEVLAAIARSDCTCSLAILKTFGDRISPGLLSFPKPGLTLALDFPFQGESTLKLLNHLDAVVAAAGGVVYPAKDASMSAESFNKFFPQWKRLAACADPKFSSSFWRRVTGKRSDT